MWECEWLDELWKCLKKCENFGPNPVDIIPIDIILQSSIEGSALNAVPECHHVVTIDAGQGQGGAATEPRAFDNCWSLEPDPEINP